MASVSGLSKTNRIDARDRAVRAAMLGVRHRDSIHYTQGPRRWQGIQTNRHASRGEYPNWADCSAFAAWCLWNGLHLGHGVRDTVNGADWHGGFTGTMLRHGKPVEHRDNVQRADCVIYGNGGNGEHTAIVVGRRGDGKIMVVSFGSEQGPLYLPFDYRDDIMGIRRFI